MKEQPKNINKLTFETLTKDLFDDITVMMEAIQRFVAAQAISLYLQTGITEIKLEPGAPYDAFVAFELRKNPNTGEVGLFAKVIDKKKMGKMH